MNKLTTGLMAIAGFFGLAGHVFAVDPEMDSTVQAAANSAISGLQSSALTNLGTLIPVAAVLLISVVLVYFIVRHFRRIAHV